MPLVRPRLKPGLRRIWRDSATLQLGWDPARAVVLTGLDPGRAQLVEALDGSADVAGLRRAATRLGLTQHAVDDLLGVLDGSGLLEDADTEERAARRIDRAERDRLAADAAAASLARPHAPSGLAVLDRRRRAAVTVVGAGRVGAPVSTLLAAAGIGTVAVEDAGTTRLADVAPGGLVPEHVGARRQDAVGRAMRRLSTSVRTSLPAGRQRPDLVVLARDSGLADPRHGERLVRAGVAHLYAGVRDVTGVVGPLVLPGRSSCQRCHDLHRTDRDPGWPAVAASMAGGGRAPVEPCDVALATAVAAHAVLQVLAWVDGAGPPSAVDGTVEIAQGDGRVRRRSWAVHPGCGCGWTGRL